VEVIRQNANRDGLEGPTFANKAVGPSEAINFFDEKGAGSVGKDDREEKYTALYIGPAIVRHGALYHA
jgi:hypothetical protein